MSRRNYRRLIAACILAACLVLVVPQTAQARLLEPSHHGWVESLDGPQQELNFWQKLWRTFESFWSRASVCITPDGREGTCEAS